jgi:phosphoribosylglycinamide formyltransferase-1
MRAAVFASGGGSNFQSIADACRSGFIAAEIALVVSNIDGAGVLERARSEGIPTLVIRSDQFEAPTDFSDALISQLRAHGIDFIILAGYMKKIPSRVLDVFPNRVLNIHPALLPSFGGKGMYGIHVHEAVIASGAKETGATVHLVDEHYDTGPIILQKRVPVLKTDSPASLAQRVLELEHRLYPEAIQLIIESGFNPQTPKKPSTDDHQ